MRGGELGAVKAKYRGPAQGNFMIHSSGGNIGYDSLDWMNQNVDYSDHEGTTSTYSLAEALKVK